MNPQAVDLSWRRSGRCDTNTCVEVALHEGEVMVRDSKNPEGPFLRFSRREWEAFVGGVGDGDFTFSR